MLLVDSLIAVAFSAEAIGYRQKNKHNGGFVIIMHSSLLAAGKISASSAPPSLKTYLYVPIK